MKLLIVEDEPSLLTSIQEFFTQEGFLCEGVGTYAESLQKIDDFDYDCIILDINLPDGSGISLLKYLRQEKKDDGVVIISARNSLDDRIEGLDLGADDYITKPFYLSELNARVKALLRRKYGKGTSLLEAGSIRLDLLARTVTSNKQALLLTKYEFDLLTYLLNNTNRVVSKQAIAEHIYGDETESMPSFNFVYSHMKNLKRKLKETGCDDLIQTVYGLGYRISI